jgi:outer membrane protein assembly factor BamB
MRTPLRVLALLALFVALAPGQGAEPAGPKATPGDWPWWRGPNRDGISPEAAVTKWGPTENVVWKTAVPGRGHSSPIVCGRRIFLTTADEQARHQFVLAFDRRTGTPLWSTRVHEGGFARMNPENSHASATPACDGERVYSAFLHGEGLYVTATDLDGRVGWQTRAGPFTSEHGYGSSPALHGGQVIVNGDSLKDSFLAALDCRSGKVRWRASRKSTGRHGGYATPVVAHLAGRPQLLLTGTDEVSSYDPETGKLLWSCDGPAEVTACTAAWGDGLVFASGGFPVKNLLAIRPDGSGDVTKSHVAWRTTRGVTYVPSPLYHAGRLYVVTDDGTVTCFEAATGKKLWQERLPGAFTASPVFAGSSLYATNEAGKTFVLKAGPTFELVATNDLGEATLATPAVCGGGLFVRTDRHLYCLNHRE